MSGFQCKESHGTRAAAYAPVYSYCFVFAPWLICTTYAIGRNTSAVFTLILFRFERSHISGQSGRMVAKFVIFLVAICEPPKLFNPACTTVLLLRCRVISPCDASAPSRKVLYLSPPLEHARAAWVHQFHAYLHTVAGLPRLRSKSFAVLGGGEGSTDYQRVVKALPREILKKAYEEIESRLAEVSSCCRNGG